MKLHKQCLAVACALGMGTCVLADDLNPAPYRDEPLSVFAEWQFDGFHTTTNGSGPYLANSRWTDDMDPSTTLSPIGFSVLPEQRDTGTLWHFNVPNWIDDLPIKFVRVQITWDLEAWAEPAAGNVESIIGYEADDYGALHKVLGVPVFWSDPTPVPDVWGDLVDVSRWYSFHDWIMEPNPDWEQINVFFPNGTHPVQVVIDTISIPTPGAFAVAGLGGLVAVRRRR